MQRQRVDILSPTIIERRSLPFEPREWAEIVRILELAPQQARIVELLLMGMADKQVAAELGLALPTVRTYLGRIFVRVGASDRVGLILAVFAVSRTLPSNGCSHCRCHRS